jgi:hypothetical protein
VAIFLSGEAQKAAAPVHAGLPDPLGVEQLAMLYQDGKVPVTRFTYPKIWELLESSQFGEDYLRRSLAGLAGDVPAITEDISRIDCNTDYEELIFVDFDARQNALVGILKLKQNCGYASPQHARGSYEYATFWVWSEMSQSWSYLGTTGINIHDATGTSSEGLYYAVSIPVSTGWFPDKPGTAKILAVLSWEIPPPLNPGWKPTWGNRLETIVLPSAFPPLFPGVAYLSAVGEIATYDIDRKSVVEICPERGLEPPANESFPDYSIRIAGFITDPPNVLAGDLPYKYRVSVRQCLDETTGTWTPWRHLTNSFLITETKQDGTDVPVLYDELQSVDPADSCYTYREQSNVDQWVAVSGDLLAVWQVPKYIRGLWEIRLEAKKPDSTPLNLPVCYKGRPLRLNQVKLRFIDKYRQIPGA